MSHDARDPMLSDEERRLRALELADRFKDGSRLPAIEQLWPALEAMAANGSSVVVKIDGGRAPAPERYTVVLSGGALHDEFFRYDTADLEEALTEAILFYDENVWSKQG